MVGQEGSTVNWDKMLFKDTCIYTIIIFMYILASIEDACFFQEHAACYCNFP